MWKHGNKSKARNGSQSRGLPFLFTSLTLVVLFLLFLFCRNPQKSSLSSGLANQKQNSFESLVQLHPTVEFVNGTNVIWQIPDSPKAVLFLAHGCNGQAVNFWDKSPHCPNCIGLPEERLIVLHALARKFAVLTISSAGRCWTFGKEKLIVKNIVNWWVKKNKLEQVPLVALGASSGGYFVSVLATESNFSSTALMIAEGKFAQMDIKENYPPTLFVHMPKDVNRRQKIDENMEILRNKGVDVAEIECMEFPLSPRILADRITGLDQSISAKLFELFRNKGFIDENGYMRNDGRGTRWKEALREDKSISLNKQLAQHVQEELNLAFAYHEMTSLQSDQIFKWWSQRNKKGPKTWPLVGAAIEQLINFNRMHDWLVKYLSESKSVVVPMPYTTYTYIADPANVEHVLKTNFSNYPKGETYHSYMEVLLGDGIFNSDGELWRKQRKTASFEFASKNLRDFSTVVFREYSQKLHAILSQASFLGQVVDMQELLMRMTLDSICKVGFGVEIGTLAPNLPENRFAQAFDIANIIVTLRFIDPLWRIKRFLNVGSEALLDKSIKTIDDFTYSVIRRRKAEIKEARQSSENNKMKHDILSRFIELGEDPESNLTDKSLRDVVLNFVIAGRDTTATTLSWAIYMIMTHSHVAEKLYSELKTFEEDRAREENVSLLKYDAEDPKSFNERSRQFAGLLSYDSLGRLYYLHAVITETLRLYPAVPQDPKGILEDDVLPDGTKVKAGGMVTYVPYSMGRMEYNWGPDAASFKPERWLKEGFFQNASPFKFTAFQAGPRICLGKDSAYLQMKMALAILCRFYEFKLVPGHLIKYRMMTILSMAHGLKVTVARRSYS